MSAIRQLEANDSLKACCATVYESDWAKLLLGDSFHPGGLGLTERLGKLLALGPNHHLLDVAAGQGTSAIYLAERFGCQVTGVDFSEELVAAANATAVASGLSSEVQFQQGDAENLSFPTDSFDAIICECAFCIFPDKHLAMTEFARVLKPGGKIGLSDLTRNGELPAELEQLLAWIACIADARPVDDYISILEREGLITESVENHDTALQQTVADVRGKLIGAELMVKLKKIDLPGVDFSEAKAFARSATTAVAKKRIGYALFVARK